MVMKMAAFRWNGRERHIIYSAGKSFEGSEVFLGFSTCNTASFIVRSRGRQSESSQCRYSSIAITECQLQKTCDRNADGLTPNDKPSIMVDALGMDSIGVESASTNG